MSSKRSRRVAGRPAAARLRLRQAGVMAALERWEDAAGLYRSLMAEQEAGVAEAAVLFLANIRLRLGDVEEAQDLLEDILQAEDPRTAAGAEHYWVRRLRYLARTPEAERLLEQASAFADPQIQALASLALGTLRKDQGRFASRRATRSRSS